MKKIFIDAFLAGIIIGIGTIIYLSVDNKVIGSLLFSLGLLSVCTMKYNLFTGKVGYVLENHKYLDIIIIWLGNFAGTFTCASLIKLTRAYNKLLPAVTGVVDTKLNDSMMSLFILGIFCGILMYTAVEIYKNYGGVLGLAAIVLCVSVFILSGFEHSIANMAYFTLYGWNIDLVIILIVITIGNSIGGMLIPLLRKVSE